jgi:hypothetical protein
MVKSSKLRRVCGGVLAALVVASACLAIGGIWGAIPGDTAMQLFATFLTVAGAANGIAYIADQFFS